MIDFGPAQLLLLPAESFVAYQLFAQQQRPDSFVVTLGFGESAPGYIPTNQAYREGFREEHGYTWNRPGAEDLIQETLRKLLTK
jgi:ABC-type nitrate/sulfonate/bicarbonate transport system substrate-binding protein